MTKKGTKLHELLAAEQTVKTQSSTILTETIKVFKKDSHFDGLKKEYTPKDENGEIYKGDEKEMITTVHAKLEHAFKFISKSLTVTLQKEQTNSSGNAKAILIIEGKEYGEYSATSLLAMEKVLIEVIKLVTAIPTLDMTRKWTPKEGMKNTYEVPETTTTKTGQREDWKVLVQATEHFPAQTQKVIIKEVVGNFTTNEWNGKMKPAEKSQIIERVDKVLSSVKTARSRANNVEISEINDPKTLFNYILGQ